MEEREWLQKLRQDYYPWCNDDQWQCCRMVFDIIGGENHLTGKIKEWGHGIAYTSKYNSLATFDGNRLTTAVFMAHDRMIRFEIQPSGPGMLRWCLWKRSGREGDISSRHPTIEMALDNYRKYWDENGRKIN